MSDALLLPLLPVFVFVMHMGVYYGFWLVLSWLGCGLGWMPEWCVQPLPSWEPWE